MEETTTPDNIVMVPWEETMVGPHRAIVYKEVNISELERLVASQQVKFEEEAEKHSDKCSWWSDWHNCNCGTFDTKE